MFIATGYIGAVKPASIVYADGRGSSGNAASYSFSSVNTGAADPSRILVAQVYYSFLTSGSFGDFSINGSDFTRRYTDGGSYDIYTIARPTGTSGTITITKSSGSNFLSAVFVLWAAYDLQSASPTGTDTAAFGSSPRSASVSVQKGGVVLGSALGPTNGNFSWSGLTERDEFTYMSGTSDISAASNNFATAQTVNVSTSYGGNLGLSVAAFR